MTLYICSYCNRLAVTLWPVTLDEKEREVCWTCIQEAAGRSRFTVQPTLDLVSDGPAVPGVVLVPTISKVEVGS